MKEGFLIVHLEKVSLQEIFQIVYSESVTPSLKVVIFFNFIHMSKNVPSHFLIYHLYNPQTQSKRSLKARKHVCIDQKQSILNPVCCVLHIL